MCENRQWHPMIVISIGLSFLIIISFFFISAIVDLFFSNASIPNYPIKTIKAVADERNELLVYFFLPYEAVNSSTIFIQSELPEAIAKEWGYVAVEIWRYSQEGKLIECSATGVAYDNPDSTIREIELNWLKKYDYQVAVVLRPYGKANVKEALTTLKGQGIGFKLSKK